MVLSEEIVSFGSLPVYGNLEIVTTQIFLPVENIWSFSTVSALQSHSCTIPRVTAVGRRTKLVYRLRASALEKTGDHPIVIFHDKLVLRT